MTLKQKRILEILAMYLPNCSQSSAETSIAVQAEVTEYIGRDDGKDLIRVTVTVETESQRGIMIGRGGAALKQLSMASRHGIEDFLGRIHTCPASVLQE